MLTYSRRQRSAIVALCVVDNMSDTTSRSSRTSREYDGVERLEKILSKHVREPQRGESKIVTRQPKTQHPAAEHPSTAEAKVDGISMDSDRGHAVRQLLRHVSLYYSQRERQVTFMTSNTQAPRQGNVTVEELDCSDMENALKEQVYRLAGRWEQGTA